MSQVLTLAGYHRVSRQRGEEAARAQVASMFRTRHWLKLEHEGVKAAKTDKCPYPDNSLDAAAWRAGYWETHGIEAWREMLDLPRTKIPGSYC